MGDEDNVLSGERMLFIGKSEADRKYIVEYGKEVIVEHNKKSVIESIVRAIREKPDEIIHWEIKETSDGKSSTTGFIEFKKP